MLEINENVVYVKGVKNGAIYSFKDNKVYSINSEGCEIIEMVANNDINSLNIQQKEFIEKLINLGIYNSNYEIHPYVEKKRIACLDMVWLEITQACNLKCLHCYEGDKHCSAEHKMSVARWIEIINELGDMGISRVVVIGGEPCVSNNLIQILDELCKRKIKTTLFTNATLMSEQLLSFIVINRDWIEVKVSIYGHNKEVHDAITQVDGSFDMLIKNTSYLVENEVKVYAAVVVMKENENCFEELIDFVKNSHLIYTRYDVIRNVFGGTQNEHTVTDKSIICKVMRNKPNFKTSKTNFDESLNFNSCWKGKMAITENGDVFPCVFERELVLGNVENTSIKELLYSENLLNCWECDWSKIDVCKDCEYRFACKDCRPLAKSTNGNHFAKNPRCTYNPYDAKWEECNE